MSVISKRFADELTEKRMRDAYLSAQTRTKLTSQIRAIRGQRGWSQGQFAKFLGKPQSNVSRLENREYGSFTLSTLFELASAFDVGLIVEFVPYDDFLRRTHDLSPSHLQVKSFTRTALEPLCRNDAGAHQVTVGVTVNATMPMWLEGLACSTAIGSGVNPPIGNASQQTLPLPSVTVGASSAYFVTTVGSNFSNTMTNNAGSSAEAPVIASNPNSAREIRLVSSGD